MVTRPAEQASREAGCGARHRKPCSCLRWPGCPHHLGTNARAASPRHHVLSLVEPSAFPQRGYLPVLPGPGGERCRRQDRPGRCSVLRMYPCRRPRRHGRRRVGRDLSAHTLNGGGTIGDSAGSLTISSNSLSSQSSSSQTHAQNWSSTAPEPTGVQVLPPSRIASHPSHTPDHHRVHVCPLVYIPSIIRHTPKARG